MTGYIGGRARKRRRNLYFFFGFLVLLLMGFYLLPEFKLTENIPSDELLPSDEEILSPKINNNLEELELKLFDKEQKIIFRNRQLDKLKKEIQILVSENKSLSNSIIEVNDKMNQKLNNDIKDENLILNIEKIRKDAKKDNKKLNDLILKLDIEKNNLNNNLDNISSENILLKKEYKSIVSKNLKLNILNDELQEKIIKFQTLIEEQSLLIKVLQDTSHHQ